MKVLLLDALPLVYSNFNKIGHLVTSTGEPTGLRYGFLRSAKSYFQKLEADRAIVVWDTPQRVHKEAKYPTYKSNRVMTDEKKKMYSQIPALQDMLSLTRFIQAEAPGFEADDIIASLSKRFSGEGHQIYIISPDNDMQHLVGDLVSIWEPPEKGKKVGTFIGPDHVKAKWGVSPERLCLYRAFIGDSSDNIPKVCQDLDVSYVTNVLNNMPKTYNLEAMRKHHQDSFNLSDWVWQRLEENLELINPANPTSLKIIKGKKDKKALSELFEKLEFKSMMKELPWLTDQLQT